MLLIRNVETPDYIALAGLIQNELGYTGLNTVRLFDRLDVMEADPRHTTLVAEQNEQVVGFLGLVRDIAYEAEGEYVRVTALAVLQQEQRKGIGSALLGAAEKYAAGVGATALILNSGLLRAGAHAFYETSGFTKRSYGFSKELSIPV